MPAGARFCNNCGNPVESSVTASPAGPAGAGYYLSAEEFICPTDQAAMRSLRGMNELNRLIQTFVKKYGKPWLESSFLGNGIKVGPDQFPRLYQLAAELGDIFCLPRLPDIYAANFMLTPMSIARTNRSCTIGTETEAFIVLDARFLAPVVDENISLEKLRKDPVYFLLAHELSHVALGHALYLSVTLWITEHGPTGLAGLTVRPFILPLQHWARQAVLSADRGVIVATGQEQDYRDFLLTLLVGNPRLVRHLNVDAYLAQLARLEGGVGLHSESISNTSPYFSRRIAALDEYGRQASYMALRSRVEAFVKETRHI